MTREAKDVSQRVDAGDDPGEAFTLGTDPTSAGEGALADAACRRGCASGWEVFAFASARFFC